MRIAVNLRQYFQGRIGGLENYVRNVIGGLDAHLQARSGRLTIFVLREELEHVREFAPGAELVGLTAADAIASMEAAINAGKFDLLFCPLLVLEPSRIQIPSAVTIPDVQHEYYPEYFTPEILAWRRQTYGLSAQLADVVFTISEYSKQTIVEKYQIPAEKVVVVDLDVDEEFRHPSPPDALQQFRSLQLPSRYIYYPANFWPHKNHETLLRAVDILRRGRMPDIHLVLTGADHGSAEIRTQIARLGLRKHVTLLSYQPRSVVAEIHRHAEAVAFISRFEGFGIPILEAFHCRTPVVCSASCSCPEVAGDAAVLVDETSPEAVAAGIEKVTADPALADTLRSKGAERAARYSWKPAIESTIGTLTSVPSRRRSRPSVEVLTYPVVSVVTPSWNMGRFIRETIDSVLTQDYPHIDYIVMDGASTDNTREILETYKGKLRYESRRDGGQADAINKGFAVSTGQVFAYLNADDTYLPGAIGTAVTHLMRNQHAGMVYGDAYYTDEAGQVIGPYPTHPPDLNYLNRNCYICQPASFMWRHAFENAGQMNVSQHYVLDYDLWMRLAKRYPIAKVDEYLATSRMYGDNKTISKRSLVYREILTSVHAHFGYVPFDWVFGFACYLVDRKDQFFEPTRPTKAKYLASLLLGMYYNPRQLKRYCLEWGAAAGLTPAPRHEDRWSDGWISRRFQREYDIDTACRVVRISGKHLASFRKPLTLTICLDGVEVRREMLRQNGPFAVEVKCPDTCKGKRSTLVIEANQTFRPSGNGDTRRLSCVIDDIAFAAD